jgi:hypothetical protein
MNQEIINRAYALYCKKYNGKPILTLYGFQYMSNYGECYDFMEISKLILRKEKIEKIKDVYSTK